MDFKVVQDNILFIMRTKNKVENTFRQNSNQTGLLIDFRVYDPFLKVYQTSSLLNFQGELNLEELKLESVKRLYSVYFPIRCLHR